MNHQKTATAKKTTKLLAILIPATAIFLAAAIALPIVFVNILSKVIKPYSPPPSELPQEETYALSKYSLEDLTSVQTTIRADVENVTERNVKRTVPQVLTDEYALVYDKAKKTLTAQYGFAMSEFNQYDVTAGNYRISNDQIEASKITFKKYPRSMSIEGQLPAHSIGGGDIGDNNEAITESGLGASGYLNFYKYMLFSQCYNLTTEAATRSNATRDDAAEQEAFKRWLKKHPAADALYGRVLGSDGKELNETNNDNAVTKKVTVDPIYRSLHATGLYLPAGEPVTLKIEGLKAGEQIGLKLNEQDSCAWVAGSGNASKYLPIAGVSNLNQVTFASGNTDGYFRSGDVSVATGILEGVGVHNHWSKAYGRLPWVRSIVNYSANGSYVYGSPIGGVIEIDMKNCRSKVTITISGAVETPTYILGSTTPEYFDKYLRQAPGVVAILDTENGQLIGPTMEMGTTQYMRQVKTDEIQKLAMLWHSFLSVNESFTGGTYNRFNKVMFDWLVPAGAAVSMGNYSFAHPTGWFNGCMNYRGLLEGGAWGPLHEIGHNHANSYGVFWGFGDGREGEVHNNALNLLSYIMFCDIGTTIRSGRGAEHGEYANPYSTLTETLGYPARITEATDYGDGSIYHYFQMLGMYANIMHSFGAEKFYELMYTYKLNGAYLSNKRADFAYRCSKIYGMNFLNYFNKFYSAHIEENMFVTKSTVDGQEVTDDSKLAFIKSLPNYEPIANFYAGGIDGVKTAGDYHVTFGDDVSFDLLNKTISTLDTKEQKGFEIVSVLQPLHGKIVETKDPSNDKKIIGCTYSFNTEYAGSTDEFSFLVKLTDGVVHKFTISLRIAYNGVQLYEYNDVATTNLNAAVEKIYTSAPTAKSGKKSAGIDQYNSAKGKQDVRVAEFYWRAPKSGTVQLAVRGDDLVRWYFNDTFAAIEEQIAAERQNPQDKGGNGQITSNSSAFIGSDYKKAVGEGKYYAVKIINLNTGGGGNAALGYKYVDDGTDKAYATFSLDDVFHPSFPQGQKAENYVFNPQFIVSKKDNVKLDVTGTDKRDWQILKAPTNVVGGRYEKQQQVDTEEFLTDANGNKTPNPNFNKPIEGTEVTIDRWTYLIDGSANTNMHTTYGGGDKQITADAPQVFILDTKKTQSFNYFTVTTRNQGNSYIRECELQIATKINETYAANYEFTGNEAFTAEWKTVATATPEKPGSVLNMQFSQTEGRYFKLIVKGTTGGKFSVLAELDTGIYAKTQKVVPITGEKIFATYGWKNSAENAELPNGFYYAEKNNEKMVVKFQGDSVALYAAVGTNYGKFSVYLDGEKQQDVDLYSSAEDMRKLVFNKENLENKEHTMEIITTSADTVMVNMVGLPYSGNLLNAPNIYFEKALIISLLVFIGLFLAVATFVICLFCLPKFRKFMLGNKTMQKYDERTAAKKAQKANAPVKKPASKKASSSVKDVIIETEARVAKPAAQPTPVAQPAQPAAKPAPAARPVAQPAQPAVKPTPAARPAAQPAQPAVKPAPVAQPTAKPATKPATPPVIGKNPPNPKA